MTPFERAFLEVLTRLYPRHRPRLLKDERPPRRKAVSSDPSSADSTSRAR